MRRADRLFQIVQFLRGGRLLTAHQLAEKLEVSARTIYRDIADLQANGVPVDGEAGIGYLLRKGYDLPPLMFTRAEVSALVIGLRLAKAWGGLETASAAEEAQVKLEAVLPEKDRPAINRVPIHAFGMGMSDAHKALFDRIEDAIRTSRKLALGYVSLEGVRSERQVRPLGLWHWGRVWTLGSWCEMRSDFRNFRLDRIEDLNVSPENFAAEPGTTLADYYRAMSQGHYSGG